jgi:CRISPR/Cas system CMR subunit Cmr6 (Cas7 group RAMP superfamily)
MISKSESNKIYYQKNKDRLAEKWKNDESRKAYLREYYKKNKGKILERAREWNKRNKEARKLIVERERRSKLKPFWEVNLQNK